MAHMEMISAMVYQLLEGVTAQEMKDAGLASHYAEHGISLYPVNADGVPFNVTYFAVTGDPVADLAENCAAEQKARATYEYLMNLTNDPDILAPLSYLRQREIVHYQRFKELYDEYVKKYYQPDIKKCKKQ